MIRPTPGFFCVRFLLVSLHRSTVQYYVHVLYMIQQFSWSIVPPYIHVDKIPGIHYFRVSLSKILKRFSLEIDHYIGLHESSPLLPPAPSSIQLVLLHPINSTIVITGIVTMILRMFVRAMTAALQSPGKCITPE
jgi:hypothetical protein